ncbi:MAG: hypothetical protein NT028_12195 [candidate division Zixibacteria bacterium]|nr:hypothetical protein [candidate division Zixibacteria bacterium]
MKSTVRVVVVVVGSLILAQFINGVAAFAIGFAVLTVWVFVDSKKSVRKVEMLRFGLSPEEAAGVESDLASGNKAAAVGRFQKAQDRQRSALLDQGIDSLSVDCVIGRDIQWTDILRQVFRVLEFDRIGTTVLADGTVKAANLHEPYGYLLVESPIFNVKARLPIIHRDDFFLATTVYDEPQVVERIGQEELLVTYFPEHKLPKAYAGTRHALHYVLVSRGTLERYYDFNDGEHMANPAPEKLFKKFAWNGEIRVEVNPDPEL